jgi:hypothetical protein
MSSATQLAKAIAALTLPGAASEAAAALIDLVEDRLDGADQATLKEALADAQAENDEGHARLQRKLAEAALR